MKDKGSRALTGRNGIRNRRGDNECVFAVRVRTDRQFGSAVEAGLRLSGLQPVSWSLADRDVATVEVYATGKAAGAALMGRVESLVASWAVGEKWTATLRRLPREDWAESWKKFFKVERVSRRVVVRPPWRSVPARPGRVVVEIEPGMSFGTGQHPTTRSCLRMLDDIAAGAAGSVLDIGCGSGILAIACVKLGLGPVVAVDNDPVAVRIAKENARRNGVGRSVSFRVADLAGLRTARRYDVVVANILAGVLVDNARRIAGFMSPGVGSRLVLSGILSNQYAQVRSAYEALGLREIRRLRDGKWTSGCFSAAAGRIGLRSAT
jgi:ribosomal protein L11 methyltransferase